MIRDLFREAFSEREEPLFGSHAGRALKGESPVYAQVAAKYIAKRKGCQEKNLTDISRRVIVGKLCNKTGDNYGF